MSASLISKFNPFLTSTDLQAAFPKAKSGTYAHRLRSSAFNQNLNPSELRQRFAVYPLGTDSTAISNKAHRAFEAQSIDGSHNNLARPMDGKAHTNLSRLSPAAYGDGVSDLSGASRPNPREISNVLFTQSEPIPDARGMSGMTWLWGQLIAHDTDLTPTQVDGETSHISIPTGDSSFDPSGTGEETISFKRSIFDKTTGTDATNQREHPNVITEWIDASFVYGSNSEREDWIRTHNDGKMKLTDDGYLPYNDGTQEMAHIGKAPGFFVAGDNRVNEHSALISIHTLFVREHNRLADEIKEANPDLSDEEIYQRARKINVAQVQDITYNEFIPAIFGEELAPYEGYDPSVDASVSTEFAQALFRFGHSTVEDLMLRLDENGEEIPEGHLSLRDAFWNPKKVTEEGGIEPILRGISALVMETTDAKFVDGLRNFLFGEPGSGGMDLASINIQRGCDHGLPDFNSTREALGLPRKESFSEISSDPEVAMKLEQLYGSVDNIDLWVGALAEDHVEGASIGETFMVGMKDQFERLRDGDRFYFENDPAFTEQDIAIIKKTSLADILERNTGIENLAENVFFSPDHQP